ncbi:MAG: hypothetical protein J1E60_03895 [Christensenellaceae bacterium]|nr:hypothetical protein [Christensenellaceae bacterium]
MGESYFAIIGDIVSSRREEKRDAVQKRLEEVLNRINEEFSDHIAANFLITLGDEFQGLLYDAPGISPLRIALTILDQMYPVRIRIAIGRGTMSTAINRMQALGADGEAFHRARSGIELIRANERHADSSILVCSCDEGCDRAVNTIIMLAFTIRRGWTSRQGEISRRYAESQFSGERITQSQLANEFGISQSTFNISLTASNAREYASGLLAAQAILSEGIPEKQSSDCSEKR